MNGSLPELPPSSPSSGQKNGRHDAEHLIELFRTLADPIRLRIVRLLESAPQANGGGGGGTPNAGGDKADRGNNRPNTGLSVGELGEILKLPQSTVSRHLKTL